LHAARAPPELTGPAIVITGNSGLGPVALCCATAAHAVKHTNTIKPKLLRRSLFIGSSFRRMNLGEEKVATCFWGRQRLATDRLPGIIPLLVSAVNVNVRSRSYEPIVEVMDKPNRLLPFCPGYRCSFALANVSKHEGCSPRAHRQRMCARPAFLSKRSR